MLKHQQLSDPIYSYTPIYTLLTRLPKCLHAYTVTPAHARLDSYNRDLR